MNPVDTLFLCGYAIGYLLAVWVLLYLWVYRWEEEIFLSEEQALGVTFMAALLWPIFVGALVCMSAITLIMYLFRPLVKIFLITINPNKGDI